MISQQSAQTWMSHTQQTVMEFPYFITCHLGGSLSLNAISVLPVQSPSYQGASSTIIDKQVIYWTIIITVQYITC